VDNEQFSFRDSVSPDSAISKLIESIFNAGNNKEYVMDLFCDLTKAFHDASHEPVDFEVGILWSKRHYYIKLVKILLA
jgi:hypothetical protein